MNNNKGKKMNKFVSLNEIDSLLSSKLYDPMNASSSYKKKNVGIIEDDNQHHVMQKSTKEKIDSILSSNSKSCNRVEKIVAATTQTRGKKRIAVSDGLRRKSDAVINAVNATVQKSYRISKTRLIRKPRAASSSSRNTRNINYSKNEPASFRLRQGGQDRRGEDDDAEGMEKPIIPRRRRSFTRMNSFNEMSNQISNGMISPPITKLKPETSLSSVSTESTASMSASSSSFSSSENSSCFSSLSMSSHSSYYNGMDNISQEFRRVLSNISTETVHFMEEENSDEEDNCTINTKVSSSHGLHYHNEDDSNSETETVVTTNTNRSEMLIRNFEATIESNNTRYSSLFPRY